MGLNRALGATWGYWRRCLSGIVALMMLLIVMPVQASEQSRLAIVEKQLEELLSRQADQDTSLDDMLGGAEVTGYLSLRGGKLTEDGYTYLGALSDEWSFSSETTYGIQIKAPVTDNASVLFQFSGDSLESDAEIDWAFVEYSVMPGLTVRAGRLRVPGFMLSEYRAVGYAYPWVQTPLEVYGVTPFLRYEGIDVRYFMTFGEFDLRLNPFIGSTRNQDLSVGKIKYAEQNSQFGGIDIQLSYRSVTARVSYSKYRFDITNGTWDASMGALIEGQVIVPGDDGLELFGIIDIIDQLVVAINDQIIPNLGGDPALTTAYEADALSLIQQKASYPNDSLMEGERDAEYFSVGLSYDSERLLMMAEFISGGIDGAFPDATGGYAMLGYRFGNWMPHLTYATIGSVDDEDEREFLPELDVVDAASQLTEGLAGANILVGLVNDIRNLSNIEQRSWTLGLRWDPVPGVAFKVEAQRIKLLGESYGYILPKSIVGGGEDTVGVDGFEEKIDQVTVLKLSLDLVF